MHVAWPGRCEDVLAALEVLAAEQPELDGSGWDPRWPNLTEAVHWLVDDTFWDVHDPGASIGTILRDEREADAVREVGNAVVSVSDRQGRAGSSRRRSRACGIDWSPGRYRVAR